MPITHPSMRRTKSSDVEQPKTETYVVEDANSEPPQVIPEHILNPTPLPEPKPASVKNPAKFSSMLEDLLFLGRATKDVDIEGMRFGISTLTQKETSALMKHLYESADASDLFTIRLLTLAYAIKTVNGVRLEDVEVDEVYDTDVDKKLDILGNMQRHVVEKLHDDYMELANSSSDVLNSKEGQEELKN